MDNYLTFRHLIFFDVCILFCKIHFCYFWVVSIDNQIVTNNKKVYVNFLLLYVDLFVYICVR